MVPLQGALLSLMAVLLAASWVPARRASLLDPMRALRSE
jgi:ABC-type lipoprotein release transport system permease subunit